MKYKNRYFLAGVEVPYERCKVAASDGENIIWGTAYGDALVALSDHPLIKTYTEGLSIVSVLDPSDPLLQHGLEAAGLPLENTMIMVRELVGAPGDPLYDRRYAFIYGYKKKAMWPTSSQIKLK
jgi:hypothetical protein